MDLGILKLYSLKIYTIKTLNLNPIFVFFFFIISIGMINAQAPFGPNIGGGGATPPTDDEESSSTSSSTLTKYIPLCPDCTPLDPPGDYYDFSGGGSGGGSGCIYTNIQNTGNDIQYIENSNLVAQAMVWDSECPSFSLIVSGDPNTQTPLNASFVTELNGSRYGTITDPDIIIAQKNVYSNNLNNLTDLGTYDTDNPQRYEIEIIIVYELEVEDKPGQPGGYKAIAYEQWHYNTNSKYLEYRYMSPSNLFMENAANLITEVGKNASYPNVDANNGNEMVITFESEDQIYSYVERINTPTILNPGHQINNTSHSILVSKCIGNNNMATPDVSISDVEGGSTQSFNPIVSYVFNFSQDIYLVQDYFSDLYQQRGSAAPCRKTERLAPKYIFPRISSPSHFDIYNEWEYAVTAQDINNRNIAVFYNYQPTFPNSFSTKLLNFDTGSQQLLQNCDNTKPAISFTGSHAEHLNSVSVTWTYDDCTNFRSNNLDVYSVGLYLPSAARIPALPDYFMPVNQNYFGEQYASSVAGEGSYIAGVSGEVFYSLGSIADNKMVYKMSNVHSQPWLRKKYNGLEEGKNAQIKIYPNPSDGNIYIDHGSISNEEPISLTVYNIEGKKVFEKSISPNESTKEIDLEHIIDGVYFIEIKQGTKNIREKLIVKP